MKGHLLVTKTRSQVAEFKIHQKGHSRMDKFFVWSQIMVKFTTFFLKASFNFPKSKFFTLLYLIVGGLFYFKFSDRKGWDGLERRKCNFCLDEGVPRFPSKRRKEILLIMQVTLEGGSFTEKLNHNWEEVSYVDISLMALFVFVTILH